MTEGQLLHGKLRDNKAETVRVEELFHSTARVVNLLFGQVVEGSERLESKHDLAKQYK